MTTKEELTEQLADVMDETVEEIMKKLKIQAFKVKMVLDEEGSSLTLEEIQDVLAENQLQMARIMREKLRGKPQEKL